MKASEIREVLVGVNNLLDWHDRKELFEQVVMALHPRAKEEIFQWCKNRFPETAQIVLIENGLEEEVNG